MLLKQIQRGTEINTTSYYSTAIGNKSLYNSTGANNIALGYQAGDNVTDGNTNILIGYDIDGTGTTLSSGNIGIGTNSPALKLHISEAMRIEPQSSPPGSAASGDLYVDSDTNELCFYNGSSWVGLSAAAACS